MRARQRSEDSLSFPPVRADFSVPFISSFFLSFPCLNHFVFLTISHPNKPFVADASAALSSDTASRSISVSMTSSHVSKSPNCFAASPSRANKLDHCSTCIASAHTHTHTHTHTHIRIPKQEPRPIRLPSRALFYAIHHSFHSIALTSPIPSPSLSEQHQKYKYKEASLTSTQEDIHIHIHTHTHTRVLCSSSTLLEYISLHHTRTCLFISSASLLTALLAISSFLCRSKHSRTVSVTPRDNSSLKLVVADATRARAPLHSAASSARVPAAVASIDANILSLSLSLSLSFCACVRVSPLSTSSSCITHRYTHTLSLSLSYSVTTPTLLELIIQRP